MDTVTEEPSYLLNADDRCDACQAQAYVYVNFEFGALMFCLHHWNKNKEGLSAHSVNEIVDESSKLLAR
jgi:hypothetical protein